MNTIGTRDFHVEALPLTVGLLVGGAYSLSIISTFFREPLFGSGFISNNLHISGYRSTLLKGDIARPLRKAGP